MPLRALGYRPVYDYRFGQYGIQATAHGAIMVEGTWYCPSMPDGMINTTKGSRDKIDQETWTQRFAARGHYRVLAKGRAR